MLQQSINVPVPLGYVLTQSRCFLRSNQIRLFFIFLNHFFGDNFFYFGIDFKFYFGNCNHLLALCNTEIQFIDLAHDVVKSIFVRGGLLLKLIFVQPEHGHHKFVDVLKGDVERV